jgi:tripartite-type tricarboxylate transporter receptor subunit TctC
LHPTRTLLLAGALAAAFCLPAHAQDFPRKPVTLVVSAAPGGGLDLISRAAARALAEEWKQPVVVDNRGGASGVIGSELVHKSAPDGYTLLTVSLSHATNPSLLKKLPYDTVSGFTPLSLYARLPIVLVTTKSLPVNNVAELVAYARANPGKLNCGSAGNGTSQHLSCELFKVLAKVNITHVPYKGLAAASADLLGGRIEILFDQISAAANNARAGTVKALAVTTAARAAAMPELPTLNEAGVTGYEAVTWFGMLGPANMPRELAARIAADLNRAMARPEHRERLAAQNFDLVFGRPEEFDTFLKAEMAKWGRAIKEAGIQAD